MIQADLLPDGEVGLDQETDPVAIKEEIPLMHKRLLLKELQFLTASASKER